jgi:MFS family permease
VHLLPMTAMLIVGSPLSGVLVGRVGPKVPMAVGMVFAAVALFGLSRLTADSDPNNTIIWFILLGLGLSPVMVGATEVIVGNAPLELAGVAGGLQSTALQLGGTVGTSVLGAILAAKINDLLPRNWSAAHLPALNGAQLAEVKSAVSVGAAPVSANTPKSIAESITAVSHETFTAGMHTSFLVAAVVALVAAGVALITSRGHAPAGHGAGV